MMKMVGLKLSNERQALHDRLVEMRNKIMAHSESEMMRMTTQPFDVSMQDGEPPIYLIQMVFDEGVTLRGAVLVETNILLREVYQAICGTLHRTSKQIPNCSTLGSTAKRREPRGTWTPSRAGIRPIPSPASHRRLRRELFGRDYVTRRRPCSCIVRFEDQMPNSPWREPRRAGRPRRATGQIT